MRTERELDGPGPPDDSSLVLTLRGAFNTSICGTFPSIRFNQGPQLPWGAGAEPVERVPTKLVADGVGVPVRGTQQPLHPVRGDLAAASASVHLFLRSD